jgi:hypothetical protein
MIFEKSFTLSAPLIIASLSTIGTLADMLTPLMIR